MNFCHHCELEIARCVCDALSGLHELVRSQKERMQDLARRAVACKHWRWMWGMAGCQGERVLDVSISGSATIVDFEDHDSRGRLPDEALPDLTDPATIGCLMELVREAYPDGFNIGQVKRASRLHDWHQSKRAFCIAVHQDGTELYLRRDSIAAALVAALEHAP